MRNIAAFMAAVIGGYFGWVIGTIADGYLAVMNNSRPGHTATLVATIVMASFWGIVTRVIVDGLTKRVAEAESHAEYAAKKVERVRERTGRTPPSPFPAYQA